MKNWRDNETTNCRTEYSGLNQPRPHIQQDVTSSGEPLKHPEGKKKVNTDSPLKPRILILSNKLEIKKPSNTNHTT